jgi:hypothetical protein
LTDRLCGFDNGSGTDAAGAGRYPDNTACIGYCPYFLQIGQPASPVLVMGMTDMIAGRRTFSAYFTFSRHDIFSSKKGIFSESHINTISLLKCKFFSLGSANSKP